MGIATDGGPFRRPVRFPVLDRLQVVDYGMYPGPSSEGGLDVQFESGLTLVLGGNGLGKTTLVRMLYRLLAGPYDIPGLDGGGVLGRRDLEPKQLNAKQRRLFADRVADGAKSAVAELAFRLGDCSIMIRRRLSDLTLTQLVVDGEIQSDANELIYQDIITNMAVLWSFGDWILLLRHLTFYFEERRELVWDPSAQRQLLRLLFLSPETARHWTESERQILKLDSFIRNLSAVVTREQREVEEAESLQESAVDVREELRTLTDLQVVDEGRRKELVESEADQDDVRHAARLSLLKAEQEREHALRALEHAKLVALSQRFPDSSETARYIFAQLFTEDECLVCGHPAVETSQKLEGRIGAKRCIICDADLSANTAIDEGIVLSDKRVTHTTGKLTTATTVVEASRSHFDQAQEQYEDVRLELQELDSAIHDRNIRIESLRRRLPAEEADLVERRDELGQMGRRLAYLREDVTKLREEFTEFIAGVTESVVTKAPMIRDAFTSYARDFLLEDCDLVWLPRKERVGQTGVAIEFPAFELDLGSSTFPANVRRTGPQQVSESQREFIDLSFRMALMVVAAEEEAGATLVVDAPESSLDAVFVGRAADVLGRFASPVLGNCLLLTSNLTDGALIPRLLSYIGDSVERRVVDLFEVAEPTAAVREFNEEYAAVRRKMFDKLESDSDRS